MKQFDAAVIGGGVLGCFVARNLRRWNISVLLLEAEEDICTGITRANSAIVYPGYDNKPGSLKAELTVRGNANMARLCEELEVPFTRCGSLLVTYDPEAIPRLRRKLENGIRNGVPGLKLLTGPEAETMEPMLRPGVAGALYAPTTGTVNPWQLGIAACENAVANGAVLKTHARVRAIRQRESGYELETEHETFRSRTVINCAGLYADRVQELVYPSPVRLRWDAAEYLVLDALAEKPRCIVFHQADSCGKGITAIPCTEGNLLISGVRKSLEEPFATTGDGLRQLHADAKALLPQVDLGAVIRSFGAVRPNPETETGENIPDFCIQQPAPDFFSLVGIKTPGLTCADELGRHLAERVAAFLGAEGNLNFNPVRKAIRPMGGEIVCQCGEITREQILEAIRRGASTVDGVKRRVGSGMGRCQGSRCTYEIEKLLEEYRHGAL